MLSLYFQVELGKDPNFNKISKKLTFYLWAFGSGLVCVCVYWVCLLVPLPVLTYTIHLVLIENG